MGRRTQNVEVIAGQGDEAVGEANSPCHLRWR
jgi:hypothetical protein